MEYAMIKQSWNWRHQQKFMPSIGAGDALAAVRKHVSIVCKMEHLLPLKLKRHMLAGHVCRAAKNHCFGFVLVLRIRWLVMEWNEVNCTQNVKTSLVTAELRCICLGKDLCMWIIYPKYNVSLIGHLATTHNPCSDGSFSWVLWAPVISLPDWYCYTN